MPTDVDLDDLALVYGPHLALVLEPALVLYFCPALVLVPHFDLVLALVCVVVEKDDRKTMGD